MKTCPICKAVGNDTDNFCGKCGYIFNQELALKRDMDQEYHSERKWNINFQLFIIVVLILFMLITLPIFWTGVASEPWLSVIMGFGFFVCLNFFISAIRKSNPHAKSRRYKPGKRFHYFRKTTEKREKGFRIRRKFFAALSILTLVYAIISLFVESDLGNKLIEILFSLLLIIILFITSQSNQMKKLRVKYHQTIDDATYFELEELGLIKETDVIIALYKDFITWVDVKAGSKILILTQDALICLIFSDRTHAQKLSVSLNQIDELSVFTMNTQKSLRGTILKIGRWKQDLRIVLNGMSNQDSPEEFVARFLKQLDNALLSRPHDEVKTYRRSEATTSENIEHIRQIEISDVPVTPSTDEVTTSDTANQPSRTIDL